MFTLIGALLTGYGAITGSDPKTAEMYQRSLNINIDLRWGIVLLVFGLIMLFLAWRGKTTAGNTDAGNKQ